MVGCQTCARFCAIGRAANALEDGHGVTRIDRANMRDAFGGIRLNLLASREKLLSDAEDKDVASFACGIHTWQLS